MIVTLITWGLMFFVFYEIGWGVQCFINKLTYRQDYSLFIVMWLGIMISTVYAQVWSLFSGVSWLAFIVLVIIALLLCVYKRRHKVFDEKSIADYLNFRNIWVLVVVIVFALILAIQEPAHYDTYLYHAQAIRWIEEFGLVKGLGNLHNRFAYNSSFMCLQALFSLKWLFGNSMHSLNGFLWILGMIYAIGTLKVLNNRKVFLSDILKGFLFCYLISESVLECFSSPGTDFSTLLLVLCIIINWSELVEKDERDYYPYGILCLLGVFASTLKLSALFVVILVIKPAVMLIKKKKWKTIAIFIFGGFLIMLPFLIRNVLISGYLVYPYANIDIFDVDWKMAASLVEYDNHEIVVWARRVKDVSLFDAPITEWLPVWMSRTNLLNRFLMIFNIGILPITVLRLAFFLAKKRYDDCLILLCSSVLFIGWLLLAPLPRYGSIYLFLVPLCYLFYLSKCVSEGISRKILWPGVYTIGVIWMLYSQIGFFKNLEIVNRLIMPADYSMEYQTKAVLWEGTNIYVPIAGGDQVNYEDFPSMPYVERLELIELRGNFLEEGIKLKEEYKDAPASVLVIQ